MLGGANSATLGSVRLVSRRVSCGSFASWLWCDLKSHFAQVGRGGPRGRTCRRQLARTRGSWIGFFWVWSLLGPDSARIHGAALLGVPRCTARWHAYLFSGQCVRFVCRRGMERQLAGVRRRLSVACLVSRRVSCGWFASWRWWHQKFHFAQVGCGGPSDRSCRRRVARPPGWRIGLLAESAAARRWARSGARRHVAGLTSMLSPAGGVSVLLAGHLVQLQVGDGAASGGRLEPVGRLGVVGLVSRPVSCGWFASWLWCH